MKTPRPSSRTPWAWAVAGLLAGTVLATLVFAPARWLASTLAFLSQGHVQLVDARGTLWNGSAQVLLTGGAGSRDARRLPGALRWQLRPQLLGVSIRLQADCCTAVPVELRIQPHWGGARLTVADGRSEWPADLLAGLGTPWNTVEPQGQLLLSSQGLQLDLTQGRLTVAGHARLELVDLSSRLSTVRPLGSYQLDLDGGDQPSVALSTQRGSLQLSGEGQWVGNRLRFRGQAQAEPEREQALSNLLNIIGRRQGAQSIITLG